MRGILCYARYEVHPPVRPWKGEARGCGGSHCRGRETPGGKDAGGDGGLRLRVHGTGRATDKSDVDLAVLLHPDPGPDFDLLGFGVEAEKVLGKSVDVVVLNRAGEHLKYMVRRDGILIYDRDPQARRRFDRWSRKAYQDFLHYHRRYVKKMKEQLRRGR